MSRMFSHVRMSGFTRVLVGALMLGLVGMAAGQAQTEEYDVVIYGGSSAGVAAGVQAKRMGKSAVLIEPSQHVGGLSVSGLGFTDTGNKATIGGISREFYQHIKAHYDQPSAWKYQKAEAYSPYRPADDAMWTFEPHVAEGIFQMMMDEAGLVVVRGERLRRDAQGIEMDGTRILSITMESGRRFRGRMFIDATYEGDLMALAGVSYTVGREGNDKYGETLNGVQAARARYHQFTHPVDPYVVPGDPSSGVIFGVDPEPLKPDGTGDKRVMAYCYRMTLTKEPSNRIPFPKPDDYNPAYYELLIRNLQAGDHRLPLWFNMMPNGKTDSNTRFAVSTNFIGQNYDYPEADYATRDRIIAAHRSYQMGLMWTLANDPRVPDVVRNEFAQWGLPKDEYTDNGHWPYMLYIREARRMVSDYVMTEADCTWQRKPEDSVGLASYTMDSHHVRRYIDENGHVRNEGDFQVGPAGPFPISYRSIVPMRGECSNLLVPVCISASHVAYGSVRMEPVFMVLGQSAATAAAIAIDSSGSVQDVDYSRLRERLIADKQILEWSAATAAATMPGIVVDDDQATFTGDWSQSNALGWYFNRGYRGDGNSGKGSKTARYEAKLPKPGRYDVRISYSASGNRASNVPVVIHHADGQARVTLNQREKPKIDRRFTSLGTYRFETTATIVISNEGTDGHVIADAVQLLPAEN